MPFAHATAAIVSVGDELTLGQTLDTNSQWLSARLGSVGIVTIEHVTVPDVIETQEMAIRRLAGRVDLIICTGGLGPTLDDLTREALARAMGDELVEDPIALAQVEAFFVARNRSMPKINAVQGLRPSRAMMVPNLEGTAPGLHAVLSTRVKGSVGARLSPADRQCEVFCLPGPPSEMRPMFEAQVLPRLRPVVGRCVRTMALHAIGLGESEIATRLGVMMDRERMPLVGTTASGGVVSIRLRYEGAASPEDADALLEADARAIRKKLETHVFGTNEETLSHAVVHGLMGAGRTLALVESCTGGLLSAAVTGVAGASAVMRAGWVPYSNEAKTRDVGAPPSLFEKDGPGAVSHQTAYALASGGLARSGATHCVAITGIAGPQGGSADKPVGTVFIALASKKPGMAEASVDSRRFVFLGDRSSVREWSVRTALAMVWMSLSGTADVTLLRQMERVVR
jgi:nicotinamide-nucleotide amidase